jgi:serine/threonine protein kinase/tetratricopeptide (TPR) repeat protein
MTTTQPPFSMTALINARYRVINTLGGNAQDNIFLVEDTLHDNALAALKTIHAGELDDLLLNNLRAEFYTLSKFKHPNIAQVYDVGRIHTTDLDGYHGALFFTMEYIEGTDLLTFTEAANWESITSIVFQIGHALEYIHRHGLIHFDIKPANIIVTDSGQEGGGIVKIIDFGFAAPRFASEGQPLRGTLEYMAPELLSGGAYDHRVDLYSLGVTLFEVITRRTPYLGYTDTETIKQHLSSPIPPLHSARADKPEFYNELVTALLQKDPACRIGSGADVVRFLQEKNPVEYFLQNVLEHVPSQRLIGRAGIADRLNRHLRDDLGNSESPLCSHPSVTIVTGESGIGKTALLQEVKLRAQTDGLLFFDSPCFAGNAQPYEPFLNLLRGQLVHVRSFGSKGDLFLHDHAEFLSRVYGTSSDPAANRIAQDSTDTETRLRFVDLWAALFFDLASISPYAVWIDNIDDADESTRELLLHILRSAPAHRVKFFVSGVSGSLIAQRLDTLRATDMECLTLGHLDEPAVCELLNVYLNIESITMTLAGRIIARLGGSPAVLLEFISQYLTIPHAQRADAMEADLCAHNGQGKFEDAMLQVYGQKIAQRKPEEVFLLRVLSCFDAPVSLGLLQQIAPFIPLRVKYFLDLLLNVGIIRSLEIGDRWFISQSRFKDYVYASLGAEKVMLHALIADTMANDAHAGAEHAELIAHQYKKAGNARNAYPFFLRAAEQKRSQYALHESLSLLNEACGLIPSEEIDISVFEHLAECYSLTGDYQNAVLLYEQLRADAVEESKRFTYAKELGLIFNREGHLDEAYGLLLEASAIARTPEEIIEVEEELSIIDISRGKYTEAFERSKRVLQSHSAADNSTVITGILNNLGIIHFYQNNPEEAVACFRRSISILQYEHQKSKLISPFLNLGNVYSAQEKFPEAARHWQQALELSQEVGNLQQEARAYNNIGIAAFNQGNHDEASAHYEKAYEIFSRLGFLPGMALCLTNIGEVHLANAQYQKALECWEKDLKLYETLHDEHGMIEIDLHLASVHLLFGHVAAAEKLLESANRLLHGSGNTAQHALSMMMKGATYEGACDPMSAVAYLEGAAKLFGEAQDHRNFCHARLKLARCLSTLGKHQQAVDILTSVNDLAAVRKYPLLQCEALLQLGILSGNGTFDNMQPAIVNYTRAFELVQTQLVTESTWQVCYRLGEEYLRRGLHEKAVLFFGYGVHALEYLATEIASDELRIDYFSSHRRGKLLQAMKAEIANLCLVD